MMRRSSSARASPIGWGATGPEARRFRRFFFTAARGLFDVAAFPLRSARCLAGDDPAFAGGAVIGAAETVAEAPGQLEAAWNADSAREAGQKSFKPTMTAVSMATGAAGAVRGGLVRGALKPRIPKPKVAPRPVPKPRAKPKSPPKCFVAGTLVLTAQGFRAIESLRVGDLVLALDEDGNGEPSWQPVVAALVTPERPTLDLVFEDEAGERHEIGVTSDHPFWSGRREAWTEASDLRAGDYVWGAGDRWHRVISTAPRSISETVYNVDIADFDTFFVSTAAVWVVRRSSGRSGRRSCGRRRRRPQGRALAMTTSRSDRAVSVQGAWDDAADGPSGGKACPTCGKEVKVEPGKGTRDNPRDWDVDHQPAWSRRDQTGRTRSEVLDDYNNDVRLECASCNRSRGAKPVE